MCAVIGVIVQNPSKEDFEMIRRVFQESKIRGMHATGISFLPKWSAGIETVQDPIPADAFVEKYMHNDNLKDMVSDDGNLYMIGHCRYSTSDLEYNQPLYYNEKSIVHNGVITQELPEKWKELYNYDCITKNDSELVLHSDDALKEFSHMSMGVVELYLNRSIRFYRNGKRPLYFTSLRNGYVVTSTSDIARRAGLEMPAEVPMNTYMTIDSNLITDIKKVYVDNLDLQEVEYETVSI
jgi:glutamine phosphoribosylpyrophosphate amidotransferase